MDRHIILLVREAALHGKKREDMETVFFYYTVIVIAVCLATAISALGALVITDSKNSSTSSQCSSSTPSISW